MSAESVTFRLLLVLFLYENIEFQKRNDKYSRSIMKLFFFRAQKARHTFVDMILN